MIPRVIAALSLLTLTFAISQGEPADGLAGGLAPARVLQTGGSGRIVRDGVVAKLWVCDADLDSIYAVDWFDGTILYRAPSPGPNPQALSVSAYAGDPVSLGYLVSDVDRDYIYNVLADGTVMDSFPPEGTITDCRALSDCQTSGTVEWDTTIITQPDSLPPETTVVDCTSAYEEFVTELWMAREDRICHWTTYDSNCVRSFPAPGPSPTGLEWGVIEGGAVTGLWICDNVTDSIYLVRTDSGIVYHAIPAPGPNPTGLSCAHFTSSTTEEYTGMVNATWENIDDFDSNYAVVSVPNDSMHGTVVLRQPAWIEIPACESAEGEAANDGCIANSQFQSVQCCDTICGNVFYDAVGVPADSDWYSIELADSARLTVCITSLETDYRGRLGFGLFNSSPGCSDMLESLIYGRDGACTQCITRWLSEGTYWAGVIPIYWPEPNDTTHYFMTFSCLSPSALTEGPCNADALPCNPVANLTIKRLPASVRLNWTPPRSGTYHVWMSPTGTGTPPVGWQLIETQYCTHLVDGHADYFDYMLFARAHFVVTYGCP